LRIGQAKPDLPRLRLTLPSSQRARKRPAATTQEAQTPAAERLRARQALEIALACGTSAAVDAPCDTAPLPPPLSATALAGCLEALHPRCLQLPSDVPVVVIASGGGPRRLPMLTPLLALWLAREGQRVLLHGPLSDPLGVTCAEVLRDLGLAPATSAAEAAHAWARREPAFIATATLCPELETLLARRCGPAWRSLARRVSRLLDPIAGAPTLRLAHHGRHDTGNVLAGWAMQEGAAVMLLRGAEGEPVADLRRRPRIDTWLQGARQAAHSCTAQGGALAALPQPPPRADAAGTALYVQAVLSGARPAPAPLAAQVALIVGALRTLGPAPG
jgi:anthranilate phosphoribosyltransferase